MKFRWAIILFFIIIGLCISPGFVYSDNQAEVEQLNKEIQARKDKIKQLEETISKYQKNIDIKRTEAVSLKNQLSILDNRMAQIEADVQLTETKISEAQLQIEALEISIKEKEAVIAKQKKIIAKMIQDIHAEDQKNYVEIMLTNKSFADFYDQLKYLENVYTDLGRSAKTLRLVKEELDNKKLQVETKKKTYEQLKQELDNKKKDLTEQSGLKQNILAETHSSELRYRTLLASLKQQYQAIEGEVRSYEEQVRKKLAEQNKLADMSSGGALGWPVPSRYITSAFHDPDYPYRRVFEHSGLDIRAGHGTAIRAAGAGYVARAKRCSSSSCYSYVLLVHTGNLSSLYGHMSSISVTEDQFVNKGDIIGYSGGTPGTVGAGPFVTGPHLHFECRLNGIPVNPMTYLVD